MRRIVVLSIALLVAVLVVDSTAESVQACRFRKCRPRIFCAMRCARASSSAKAAAAHAKPDKATTTEEGDTGARVGSERATDEEASGGQQPKVAPGKEAPAGKSPAKKDAPAAKPASKAAAAAKKS